LKSDDVYSDSSIALLIWNTEVENDAHVCLGRIKEIEGEFAFVNEQKGWRVSLDNEKIERLRPVTAELKEVFLEADNFFSFSMAGLPDDPDQNFEFTGMKWH
jgi:hypothetical protein